MRNINNDLIYIMRKLKLYALVKCGYDCFFRWDERRVNKSFGVENDDVRFLIIRPAGKITGLLGIFLHALDVMAEYDEQIEPLIDLKNYDNQFMGIDCGDESLEGNPWDLFFKQPSLYRLSDAYKSSNVTIDGWTIDELWCNHNIVLRNSDMQNILQEYNSVLQKHPITVSDYINKLSKPYVEKYIDDRTLGVFTRGTDYVSTKPYQHFVQPTAAQQIPPIINMVERYNLSRIFLVTEDCRIREELEEASPVPIYCIEQPEFKAYDYSSRSYVNDLITDKRVTNENYLIKCVCLSKCNYIVSSIASGSIFANLIKGESYIDSIYLNLGKYT